MLPAAFSFPANTCGACRPSRRFRSISSRAAIPRVGADDDGLNTNPPAPCQIGKRPPAPNPKRESAGHQGVAGGGCLWGHAALSCRGGFVGDLAGARVGGEELGGPVGGWAVRPSWSAGSGIPRCSEWQAPQGCDVAWAGWPCCRRSGPVELVAPECRRFCRAGAAAKGVLALR